MGAHVGDNSDDPSFSRDDAAAAYVDPVAPHDHGGGHEYLRWDHSL